MNIKQYKKDMKDIEKQYEVLHKKETELETKIVKDFLKEYNSNKEKIILLKTKFTTQIMSLNTLKITKSYIEVKGGISYYLNKECCEIKKACTNKYEFRTIFADSIVEDKVSLITFKQAEKLLKPYGIQLK